MKNNYIIIPKKIEEKSIPNVVFLYPLKGFCVGFQKEYSLEEIPKNAYFYVNRLLDTVGIKELKELLRKQDLPKGIVFEDLGIYEMIHENQFPLETIFFSSHAVCSLDTANTYLFFMDSVVISPDITFEEMKDIVLHAKKKVCLYVYGPLFYMYSRRSLVSNYAKHFHLSKQNPLKIKEPIHEKEMLAFENDFGTVIKDQQFFDGRELLTFNRVNYFLLNFELEEYESLEVFLNEFINGLEIKHTTTGFLHQKTIYRLPPKKE